MNLKPEKNLANEYILLLEEDISMLQINSQTYKIQYIQLLIRVNKLKRL